MFQKGVSGNPAGKPKGTVDKKWQSIQAIWNMFIAEYPKLKPNEKSRYMLEIFKLHFERAIAQLPKETNDSVMSAQKMLDVLKDLEAKNGNGSRSNTPSMADRKAEV